MRMTALETWLHHARLARAERLANRRLLFLVALVTVFVAGTSALGVAGVARAVVAAGTAGVVVPR